MSADASIAVQPGNSWRGLGLWDASRTADTGNEPATRKNCYRRDTRPGHILQVVPDGDDHERIAVFVNRPPPADLLQAALTIDQWHLLRAPTGTIEVGSFERYEGHPRPHDPPPQEFRVPPGSYLVRCLAPDFDLLDEEQTRLLGASDEAYMARIATRDKQLIGAAVLLVMAGAVAAWSWSWWGLAAAISLAGCMAALRLWALRRNPRLRAINTRCLEHEREFFARFPSIMLEFRRLDRVTDAHVGGRFMLHETAAVGTRPTA